jgi:quercetin dioxygenase-like cupin family protein
MVSTSDTKEVDAYWMGGRLIVIHPLAKDPDAPSYTESVLRVGQGPEMVVHRYADFDYYVLDGMLTFSVGGVLSTVSAGGLIRVERGTPHTYLVEHTDARVLQITTPGHFWVDYVRALGTPAVELTLPPPDFVPVPMDVVRRLATANGLEFLGGRLAGASREGRPT